MAQGEKISGKAVKPMKSGLKAENLGKLVAVDDSQMFNPTPPPRRPRKVCDKTLDFFSYHISKFICL